MVDETNRDIPSHNAVIFRQNNALGKREVTYLVELLQNVYRLLASTFYQVGVVLLKAVTKAARKLDLRTVNRTCKNHNCDNKFPQHFRFCQTNFTRSIALSISSRFNFSFTEQIFRRLRRSKFKRLKCLRVFAFKYIAAIHLTAHSSIFSLSDSNPLCIMKSNLIKSAFISQTVKVFFYDLFVLLRPGERKRKQSQTVFMVSF